MTYFETDEEFAAAIEATRQRWAAERDNEEIHDVDTGAL
jgi:hypothetical protein